MTNKVIFSFDPSISSYNVARMIREKLKILLKAYLQTRISREAARFVRDGHSHWLDVVLPERIQLALGDSSDQYLFGCGGGSSTNQTGFAGLVALLEVDRPRKIHSSLMERIFEFRLLEEGKIEIVIYDGEPDEELTALWLSKLEER